MVLPLHYDIMPTYKRSHCWRFLTKLCICFINITIFACFHIKKTNMLSNRVISLSESETIAIAKKSRELKKQGIDVINLGGGQSNFNTPDFIKEAGKKAIDDNFSFYPPVAGLESLKTIICEKLWRDNHIKVEPNQVVVSNGAKQAISNVILSLINPGDEVLLPTPYWVSYREIIKLAGGTPIFIPTTIEDEFKITGKDIEKYITDKTKLLILISPGNPSGAVYSKEAIKDIAKTVKKYPQLHVISDEIYELITFEQAYYSISKEEGIKNQVIIANGVSKSFSMTGWRVGYSVSHPKIAAACEKIQGQITSGINAMAQKAAEAALRENPNDLEELKMMNNAFWENREIMMKELSKIKGLKILKPQGAFYGFPDISCFFGKTLNGKCIENSTDFSKYLLDEAHVAVVPGIAFGNDNCIRLSFAIDKKRLKEALDRIVKALS